MEVFEGLNLFRLLVVLSYIDLFGETVFSINLLFSVVIFIPCACDLSWLVVYIGKPDTNTSEGLAYEGVAPRRSKIAKIVTMTPVNKSFRVNESQMGQGYTGQRSARKEPYQHC